MENIVFDNLPFDHWLTQKSQEILSKVDKEKLTTEDMLVLTLKAQTNHFHHMDVEFRDEFSSIKHLFQDVKNRFEEVDKRFEQVDKRFDRLTTILMWGFSLLSTLMMGIFIKLAIL